jgi:4-carboxymuconolactone decarboxylase
MSDETYEKGLAIRKAVLGDDYVNASLAKADDFNADFQRLVTEFCWGAGWGREGALSRRDRSLMNIVLLGALNRGEEFKLHVRGALRNGVTREEIREALIHLSIYAGIPAGVEGFRLARQILTEVDAEGGL